MYDYKDRQGGKRNMLSGFFSCNVSFFFYLPVMKFVVFLFYFHYYFLFELHLLFFCCCFVDFLMMIIRFCLYACSSISFTRKPNHL